MRTAKNGSGITSRGGADAPRTVSPMARTRDSTPGRSSEPDSAAARPSRGSDSAARASSTGPSRRRPRRLLGQISLPLIDDGDSEPRWGCPQRRDDRRRGPSMTSMTVIPAASELSSMSPMAKYQPLVEQSRRRESLPQPHDSHQVPVGERRTFPWFNARHSGRSSLASNGRVTEASSVILTIGRASGGRRTIPSISPGDEQAAADPSPSSSAGFIAVAVGVYLREGPSVIGDQPVRNGH